MSVQVIAHPRNKHGWGVSIVELDAQRNTVQAFTLYHVPERKAQDEYLENAVKFFTALIGCVERVDQR